MTKDNIREALPFVAITALLLGLSAVHPLAARAFNTVAVSVVNPQGQPLPQTTVVLLNDEGLVATTGKTDDKGRYCVTVDALTAGKEYRVCVLQPNNTTSPCTKGVAAETDCATALLALGTGGAAPQPAAAAAAADGHAATEVLGTGLAVGAAGAGIAVGSAGSSGSAAGGTESSLKAVVAPPVSKSK